MPKLYNNSRGRGSTRRKGVNARLQSKKRKQQQKQQLRDGSMKFFRKSRKILLVILLVSLLGGVAWSSSRWLGEQGRVFSLESVTLQGISQLDREDILDALNLELGVPLWSFDLATLEAGVAKLPGVEEVEVSREMPDGLLVRIVESSPVARILQGKSWKGVTAGGILLDHTSTTLSGLPVVEAGADGELAQVAAFLQAVRKSSAELFESVSQAVIEKDGNMMLYLDGQGPRIRMKAGKDAEKSLRKMEILFGDFPETWKDAKELDLRFPDFAFVR